MTQCIASLGLARRPCPAGLINSVNVTRVSYNGGAGGITVMPTPRERLAEREQHIQPTAMQRHQAEQARGNPALAA
ncbi:MAG TPA: hypothetical protein VN691_04945 [Steroidobacteraceae bacterium]|nr:hypothetical protein [Steroidobacteraceae bacterium]